MPFVVYPRTGKGHMFPFAIYPCVGKDFMSVLTRGMVYNLSVASNALAV